MKDDKLHRCYQIIELWKGHYTDKQIRDKLDLTMQQMHSCLQLIQTNEEFFTDTIELFKRGLVFLAHWGERLERELDNSTDPRIRAKLFDMIGTIPDKKANLALKYGVQDLARVLTDSRKVEMDKYKKLSTPDLIAETQKELSKWN